MTTRRYKRKAVLHKIEATYGVDILPTAADAIIMTNMSFTPLDGTRIERDLMLPYLGNQGVILAGIYARVEGEVEFAGAGAAGTVPKYGSMLRACGMSETVTAATDVTYEIIEDGVESSSLYFVSDKVQHVLLGCQGNVAVTFDALGLPKLKFSFIGMLGTISDIGAMPAVSQAGWITPLPVNKANTALTLHGWDSVAESLTIDLGNQLTPRFLIGEELMIISDRKSTGTAVVKAVSLAEINWFAKAISRERDTLELVHGTVAGNIVEVQCAAIEIGQPTEGQKDNITNYTVPLDVCPDVGLDELKIIVR